MAATPLHGVKYFAESTGTIFYRSRLAPELLCRIITALAEGVGLHATARIFRVDPNTVLACLVKAAEQMEAVSNYLMGARAGGRGHAGVRFTHLPWP